MFGEVHELKDMLDEAKLDMFGELHEPEDMLDELIKLNKLYNE